MALEATLGFECYVVHVYNIEVFAAPLTSIWPPRDTSWPQALADVHFNIVEHQHYYICNSNDIRACIAYFDPTEQHQQRIYYLQGLHSCQHCEVRLQH